MHRSSVSKPNASHSVLSDRGECLRKQEPKAERKLKSSGCIHQSCSSSLEGARSPDVHLILDRNKWTIHCIYPLFVTAIVCTFLIPSSVPVCLYLLCDCIVCFCLVFEFISFCPCKLQLLSQLQAFTVIMRQETAPVSAGKTMQEKIKSKQTP